MRHLLLLIPLFMCLSISAETIYKSVDARGRITFSDSPPAQAVRVEILALSVPEARPPQLYLARMAAMTELTDKMAAARAQREQVRLEARQLAEKRNRDGYAAARGGSTRERDLAAGFSAYGGYGVPYPGRVSQRHNLPYPRVNPQLQSQRGPALVNRYPASLVRRSYSPGVAAVFQNAVGSN